MDGCWYVNIDGGMVGLIQEKDLESEMNDRRVIVFP